MVIDVFFRHLGKRCQRPAIREMCRQAWKRQEGIRFWEITPDMLNVSDCEFQRSSRILAEALAKSSIYILTDDDMWIGPSHDMVAMERLMRAYPQFAILAPMPDPAVIHPWTPEDDRPLVTDDVMEHVSVGSLRWTRKGAMREWPPMGAGPHYDGIHSRTLRETGWRVGYARHIRAFHLGEGQSTLQGKTEHDGISTPQV